MIETLQTPHASQKFNPMERSIYRTGLYLRLSRDDGDKAESDSITNQRKLLLDYVNKHPEFCVVDEYVDDGYSGSSFDRPAFKRLYEDLESGAVNCIIVKDLSRFGRNYIEVGRYLERLFPMMGVRLIAVTDYYDGLKETNRSDALIVPIKNLINDAYCRDMSVKIKTQLEAKRKRGEYAANFAPYGYIKDPNNRNKLIVDEDVAENVKQIFVWKLQGVSDSAIADRLNAAGVLSPSEYRLKRGERVSLNFKKGSKSLWSLGAVYRILHDETYCGNLVQGKWKKLDYRSKEQTRLPKNEWTRVENAHEGIIDKRLFSMVQELMTRDTRNGPGKDTAELFTGFLHCSEYGHGLIKSPAYYRGHKSDYYVCRRCQNAGRSFRRLKVSNAYVSTLDAIKREIALVTKMSRVMEYAGNIPFHRRKAAMLDKQIVQLQEDADRYTKLKAGLYDDYANGILNRDEYLEYTEMYRKRIEDSVTQMRALSLRRKALTEQTPDSSWMETFKKYGNITCLDRAILAELVDTIDVTPDGKVEVRFRGQNRIEDMLESLRDYLEKDGTTDGERPEESEESEENGD